MSPYTLNLGLLTNDGREIESLIGAAIECDLLPVEFEVHGGTLVVAVQMGNPFKTLFESALRLSVKAGRDAIAVWDTYRNCGYLVGYHKEAYGDFDTSKFHFLSPAPTAH